MPMIAVSPSSGNQKCCNIGTPAVYHNQGFKKSTNSVSWLNPKVVFWRNILLVSTISFELNLAQLTPFPDTMRLKLLQDKKLNLHTTPAIKL